MIIKKVFKPKKDENGLTTIYDISQVGEMELVIIKEFLEKFKISPGLQVVANVMLRTIKEALDE